MGKMLKLTFTLIIFIVNVNCSGCFCALMQVLCPFTGCYPFYDEDPYILSECPHILFAGNQPHLKHRIHKGMISI